MICKRCSNFIVMDYSNKQAMSPTLLLWIKKKMKKKILLELHKESGTNNLLLDSQDVFKFIGESTNEEMRLFYYIDKWCEWLNYYFTHTVTCNGNIEEIQLRSWLDGYNYAKQIDEQEFNDRYILVMRGYEITIMKPRKEDEKR